MLAMIAIKSTTLPYFLSYELFQRALLVLDVENECTDDEVFGQYEKP